MHSYNPKLRNLCHTRAHALINGLPRALCILSLTHFLNPFLLNKKREKYVYMQTPTVYTKLVYTMLDSTDNERPKPNVLKHGHN